MAKRPNRTVLKPRTKGIRFQGEIARLLRQATGRQFVTHSTELADIYPKDNSFGYIFECKNLQEFSIANLLIAEWPWTVLKKVEKEAIGINKHGIVVAKGNYTGVWAFALADVMIHVLSSVQAENLSGIHLHIKGIIAIPFGDILQAFKHGGNNGKIIA